MQFGRHAGIQKATRIFYVLIRKQIDRPDADKGGRQAAKVSRTRRHGVLRNAGATRILSKERPPAETVCLFIPHIGANVWRHPPRRACPVVEHRINQHLEKDGTFAAIARRNGKQCRMPAAPHFSITAIRFGSCQSARVGMRPQQAGIIVLYRAGISRFRRQPIIDSDRTAIQRYAKFLQLANDRFALPKMKPPPCVYTIPGRDDTGLAFTTYISTSGFFRVPRIFRSVNGTLSRGAGPGDATIARVCGSVCRGERRVLRRIQFYLRRHGPQFGIDECYRVDVGTSRRRGRRRAG